MAGDFVEESELNLKGIHKYFNSYTLRGRFNWVVATYGTLFGLIILYKLWKTNKSHTSPKSSTSCQRVESKGTDSCSPRTPVRYNRNRSPCCWKE